MKWLQEFIILVIGHKTSCLVDQFEQYIRSICDLPLGDGKRYADIEMINLLEMK